MIISHSIKGVVSNEETLWSLLEQNIPNSRGISSDALSIPIQKELERLKPDLIIQNSNLGKISNKKTISFLQDPFIEMKQNFDSVSTRIRLKILGVETYADKIKKQSESLQNSIRVTNSNYMKNLYKKFGDFQVIPIGVDQDIFRQLDKIELRKKYKIPLNKKVNIFVGSQHSVKGFEKIKKMIQDDPNIFWVLVLKDSKIKNGHNFICFEKVSHNILVELYNCADLCVSRSTTESFGLALVEAMFCGIPIDTPKVGIFWDWEPDFDNPRKAAIDKGLDKNSWMNNWRDLINSCLEQNL